MMNSKRMLGGGDRGVGWGGGCVVVHIYMIHGYTTNPVLDSEIETKLTMTRQTNISNKYQFTQIQDTTSYRQYRPMSEIHSNTDQYITHTKHTPKIRLGRGWVGGRE